MLNKSRLKSEGFGEELACARFLNRSDSQCTSQPPIPNGGLGSLVLGSFGPCPCGWAAAVPFFLSLSPPPPNSRAWASISICAELTARHSDNKRIVLVLSVRVYSSEIVPKPTTIREISYPHINRILRLLPARRSNSQFRVLCLDVMNTDKRTGHAMSPCNYLDPCNECIQFCRQCRQEEDSPLLISRLDIVAHALDEDEHEDSNEQSLTHILTKLVQSFRLGKLF